MASLVEAILSFNSAHILQHNMRELLKKIPTVSQKLPGALAKLQRYNRHANLTDCLFACRLFNNIICDLAVFFYNSNSENKRKTREIWL